MENVLIDHLMHPLGSPGIRPSMTPLADSEVTIAEDSP